LPVLNGCETWSLSSKEDRRLRVFENWALRRIFGPKKDEVTYECRKLHNEEFIDRYSQIVTWVKNEMSGACSTYGGEESCIQGLHG
jgi:hypothetical protein